MSDKSMVERDLGTVTFPLEHKLVELAKGLQDNDRFGMTLPRPPTPASTSYRLHQP